VIMTSRWADEIEDDDYTPTTPTVVQEVNKHIPKDDERIVTEIKIDPDSGKKMQIFRTFRLEKQLGKCLDSTCQQ